MERERGGALGSDGGCWKKGVGGDEAMMNDHLVAAYVGVVHQSVGARAERS
jgi:hypothetical protein